MPSAMKLFLIGFCLLLGWPGLPAAAADRSWPAATWERADPAALGWSAERLAKVEQFIGSYRPTAVVIVQDGKIIATWGDETRKTNVRSVRKSLLSALFGIGVSEGRIKLDRTVGELGLDDRPPSLTEEEKQATIRDLLMARSGIYHPAAYETRDMAERRPARGSHPPGSFWYYNNWDFNALGAIYERLTGANVFNGFADRIARPIGMQDFKASDGKFVFHHSSEHPAYTMRLTARDLARFGWLFLNQGDWSGAQTIPAEWVQESTKAWSLGDRGRGYGYLWWTVSGERVRRQPRLAGSYMALGHGGQALAVIPSLRLVVAQVADAAEGREWIRGGEFHQLLPLIAAAAGP
jgi:CubicO group peptidase (beta-lactamase class C family)